MSKNFDFSFVLCNFPREKKDDDEKKGKNGYHTLSAFVDILIKKFDINTYDRQEYTGSYTELYSCYFRQRVYGNYGDGKV